MFVVAKSVVDRKDGTLTMVVLPSGYKTNEEAHDAMACELNAELEVRGLENNYTCGEDGSSVPGGYIVSSEAGIYDYADFANGKLMQLVLLAVYERQ